jgi:hypothetical protein
MSCFFVADGAYEAFLQWRMDFRSRGEGFSVSIKASERVVEAASQRASLLSG